MMSIRKFINILLLVFAAATFANASTELETARLFEAEAALSHLGYWVLNIDGKPDASTSHAIMAFQKVEGLKRTGKLTDDVLEALRFASRPAAQFDTGASHVEVDIKRQVLFLTDDSGTVVRILAVSTGTEQKYVFKGISDVAHTPRGEFTIYSQIDNVREAPLGSIYYPSYFSGGVAIHGSNSIPAFPASHGCVRVPRYADQALNHMLSVGMKVFVYDDHFLTRAPGTNTMAARTSWFAPAKGRLFEGQGLFARDIFANTNVAATFALIWEPMPSRGFDFADSRVATLDRVVYGTERTRHLSDI